MKKWNEFPLSLTLSMIDDCEDISLIKSNNILSFHCRKAAKAYKENDEDNTKYHKYQ